MDATLKEVNLKRSLKKFFVDGLPSRTPNFDKIQMPEATDPSITSWMSILLEGGNLDTVSEVTMTIFLFTRKDKDGMDLSAFGDEIVELIHDPGGFILYDTSVQPWTEKGGVQIHIVDQANSDSTPDGTKMKWIQTLLKWTAKW